MLRIKWNWTMQAYGKNHKSKHDKWGRKRGKKKMFSIHTDIISTQLIITCKRIKNRKKNWNWIFAVNSEKRITMRKMMLIAVHSSFDGTFQTMDRNVACYWAWCEYFFSFFFYCSHTPDMRSLSMQSKNQNKLT